MVLGAGFLWLQTLFAVGDAGALTARQVRLYKHFWEKHAQKGDILLLLGDNLYPAGYRGRKRDKKRWERLLQVAHAFPGEVWATPGNHDWKAGLTGLSYQAENLPHKPLPGHVGPDTLSRPEWLLIFLDSERLIRDTTRAQAFQWRLIDSLLSDKRPCVIVLHHPPKTAGAHGGHFPLIAHLFPLRVLSKYLWIPLPGIGTLLIIARKSAKHPTDLAFPGYARLADSLLSHVEVAPGTVLLLAGHDHNLQIHQRASNKWVVVSGSGCKTEPVARRKATWARAVVGLWKISPPGQPQAYALRRPTYPIWKFDKIAVP